MTATTLDYLAHYEDGVSGLPYQLGYGGPAANARPAIFVPGTAEGYTDAQAGSVKI